MKGHPIISVLPEDMLFSHSQDQTQRSRTPLRPVPHDNLFLEPKTSAALPAHRSAARRNHG